MTYRVRGVDPKPFAELFGLSDEALEARGEARMTVTGPTLPCRVSHNATRGCFSARIERN